MARRLVWSTVLPSESAAHTLRLTAALDDRNGGYSDTTTGAGPTGATVTNAADPSRLAHTAATPADPATGDGLYWLFAAPAPNG